MSKKALLQFVISLVSQRLTPIVLSLILGGVNFISGHNPQAGALVNAAQVESAVLSVVGIVLVWLVTILTRLLSRHVRQFQELLQQAGLPVTADGWFGPDSLKKAMDAINDPQVQLPQVTTPPTQAPVATAPQP